LVALLAHDIVGAHRVHHDRDASADRTDRNKTIFLVGMFLIVKLQVIVVVPKQFRRFAE
jgi:hypothetical protein